MAAKDAILLTLVPFKIVEYKDKQCLRIHLESGSQLC